MTITITDETVERAIVAAEAVWERLPGRNVSVFHPSVFRAALKAALSTLPTAAPHGVGEGWQLVPKEPTQDMARRFISAYLDHCFSTAYNAMLAAAPQPAPVAGREAVLIEAANISIPVSETHLLQADGFTFGWSSAIAAYRKAIRALASKPKE